MKVKEKAAKIFQIKACMVTPGWGECKLDVLLDKVVEDSHIQPETTNLVDVV